MSQAINVTLQFSVILVRQEMYVLISRDFNASRDECNSPIFCDFRTSRDECNFLIFCDFSTSRNVFFKFSVILVFQETNVTL